MQFSLFKPSDCGNVMKDSEELRWFLCLCLQQKLHKWNKAPFRSQKLLEKGRKMFPLLYEWLFINPEGLAQVVRALVFVVVPWDLRFKSPWVQIIYWSQPDGEVGVLPDPSGGSALHRFEVYLTGMGTRSDPALEGFLVIKKKKKMNGFFFSKFNHFPTRPQNFTRSKWITNV